MRLVRIFRLRMRSLLRQDRVDRELNAELQFHLERQIAENVARGVPPDEARAEALRSLGGIAQIAEACRDTRRVTPIQDAVRDVQYGWRVFARNPVFAIVAIATLALGIGATTAIFSVVNGVLLQPLRHPEAGRIVSLGTRFNDEGGREIARLTYGDVLDLREGRAFDAFSAYWGGEVGVQVGGAGQFAGVYFVEPAFFRVFSAVPSRGRVFSAADKEQAAVVGQAFASRVFGGAERAVGKVVSVEDHAYEIVGVLSAGFAVPRDAELWVPLPPLPAMGRNRTAFNFQAVARLARGTSLGSAQAEMTALGARLARAFPDSNRDRSFSVVPLRDRLVAPVRSTLYLLLGAVVLVLIVACVNVANLLLARAATRTHEIGLRAALGAGRGRILRQLIAESLLLALVGGVLGVALAYAGTDLLTRFAPGNLPRLDEVGVDWRVLAFAGICSVAASLMFGLAPAWQASVGSELKIGAYNLSGRGVVTRGATRLWSALVIAEIALSFSLAVGAGLLFRSFISLTGTDLGYRHDSTLVLTAHRPAKGLRQYVEVARFFSGIGSQLSSVPGVTGVGVAMGVPTGPYGSNGYYSIEGRPAPGPGQRPPHAGFGLAGPGYFAALGIPVTGGRDFTDADRYDAPFVAIVNRSLARESFPGQDPIGRRLRCGLDAPDTWMTVVGIVGDVRQDSPGSPPTPQIYMPLEQHPYFANEVQVVLRAGVAPASLAPLVRKRMHELTPETAIRFATMEDMVAASIGTPRFRTFLVGVFAGLALLLAMAGVYGVMAYLTAQRTAEFGVRAVLGARRRELFSLVLGRAARLAVSGLAAGVLLSIAGARLVAGMLFGVRPLDVSTYAAALGVLAAVVLAAAAIPAWQASRVDPIDALRRE